MPRIFRAHGANPCPSPLLRFLSQYSRGVHKRTAIQLPRPRYKHKSRALSHSATPGLCGVYLSGLVSSARQRLVVRLSRQLRASSRQSQPDASIPTQDARKNIPAA